MMNEENQEHPTLKALREAAHLTQPELSRRMNVGIRTIGDWERGTYFPGFDRAISLAVELQVSLKSLAKSMRLDVSKVPNDGLTLQEVKAMCKKLGIERVEDLPDDSSELLRQLRSHPPGE
jgi:transcriptional regulator with XRE-family HTH domain